MMGAVRAGTGCTIRRANDEDVAEVVRIERESFSDPWSAADFVSVMSMPQAIFLVAVDASGLVAGYVMSMVVADESEILNIAVDPSRRGGAIGGILLDAALTAGEAQGVVSTFLEVRESNEPAIRLYRSRGFEEISRRKKYYRSPAEDALVLRRAMQR
jgi:ribosomal-protein-alanine N-acetyltransferase